MQVVSTIAALRERLAGVGPVALVPTMGNLHDGHLALVARAKASGATVVASVFVNRLQFAPHEDFDTYPRTFERDCALLEAHGCDVVFAPPERELYPEPQTFKVHPDTALADVLEGHFRPGFFIGVCTVVMKLFCCVQPSAAYFGKKDYQQLLVIRRMVEQFAMPIGIVPCEDIARRRRAGPVVAQRLPQRGGAGAGPSSSRGPCARQRRRPGRRTPRAATTARRSKRQRWPRSSPAVGRRTTSRSGAAPISACRRAAMPPSCLPPRGSERRG